KSCLTMRAWCFGRPAISVLPWTRRRLPCLTISFNLPRLRGATNRKTSRSQPIAPRSGFVSGFVLCRGAKPLPERRELGRIGACLRRYEIEAGIGRQRDLKGNDEASLGDVGLDIGGAAHRDPDT